MTTTPQTIVAATAAVLGAAGLPGSPTIHPWRLLPFADTMPTTIAVLANQATDAPTSETHGPASFARTQTLSIIAVLAQTSTDADLGLAAVTMQEAILDALFADEAWCGQWLRVANVDASIDPDRSSDVRRAAVLITIRGEYSVTRAFADPDGVCDLITYENDEQAGGELHGQTEA
jgi:hypothetical protein